MSTNAPKAVTLVTTPSSFIPSRTSSILVTSSRNAGGTNTLRGSRPGLASSATMSLSVGSPTPGAMYFLTSICFAAAPLPTSAFSSIPASAAIRSTIA